MFRSVTQCNPFNQKQLFHKPIFSASTYVPQIRFTHTDPQWNYFFTTGNQYLLNNQFQKALDHYHQCDIVTDSVLNNMGACHAQLKQYDLAKASYQRALRLKLDNFESNYNLACLYHLLKDTNQAYKYFKIAHELDPSHQLARKNYLSILQILLNEDIDSKRYRSAHDKLDEIIKYEEYFEYGLTEKGRLYLECNQFADALKCFREVIHVNPECTESRMLYVKTLAATNELVSKLKQSSSTFQNRSDRPTWETTLPTPPPKSFK